MAGPPHLLIAGGGIGGLAAALACARQGWQVQVLERAAAFGEVGAGVQIGPNVVRLLQAWDLGPALREVAAFPERLRVRDAASGSELAQLHLAAMPQRYGAPYATLHRADLLALLYDAVAPRADVAIRLDRCVQGFTDQGDAVQVQTTLADGRPGPAAEADALLGADGLWSRVREGLLADGPPRLTGHLAYRALLPQAALPAALRSQDVSAWLGPRLHLVSYPVRGGDALNVVAFVHGTPPGASVAPELLAHWDHGTNAADLQAALSGCCAPLQDLVRAVDTWRLWVLSDRPPLRRPAQMAQGRVALLGDAAHPMRPYLAQGAGMAIEDAEALGRALAQVRAGTGVPAALARYADERWRRNARVQARAQRNGTVFHATGLLRLGRNLSLRLLGERLLDMPWLYGPPAGAAVSG